MLLKRHEFWFLLFVSETFTFESYPFRNISLSWEERTNDLISRLTIEEVIDQLSHGGISPAGKFAPEIKRLGIRPYQWDTECLRGHVGVPNATSFPQSIGISATFSREVIYEIADATSKEVRANFNNFSAYGDYGQFHGMSCFSPMPNIMRHPTWGRNQETYGEDPFLAGQLSSAYISGMQGSHPRYARTTTVCKAFDAYTGPEKGRMGFFSNITERDRRMTFLPQFEECVRAGTYGFMCSYNGVNGVPNCANHDLLTGILREEWGFTGYVVSDMGADRNLVDAYKYAPNYLIAAVMSVEAGQNLELSSGGEPASVPPVLSFLKQAVDENLVSSSLLYERVRPLFYTRMRLGEFDPPELNPYSTYKPRDFVQSVAHRQVAVNAAAKSYVLLKNQGLLPLKPNMRTVAVVGPFLSASNELYGDYSAVFNAAFATSPLEGVRAAASAPGSTLRSAPGCNNVFCTSYDREEVIKAVTGATIVFLCLGTGSYETEGRDRPDMKLVANQSLLFNDVLQHAPSSARLVLLLVSAGPITLGSAWSRLDAVIQMHFPAQAAGDALYRVLSGKENPAARLPYTWYTSLDHLPDISNYSMSGRTYRYLNSEPLFPFGYGLSYSKFEYSELKLSPERLEPGQSLQVSVAVKNQGPFLGDEVVQVYVSWPRTASALDPPQRQLVAFSRPTLAAGESYMLTLTVNQQQLRLWDNGDYTVVPGTYTLYVGGQQPNQKISLPSNVLMVNFTVETV